MAILIGIFIWKKVPQLITGGLDSKIKEIRDQLDEAKQLRGEAETLRDEYAAKIKGAEKDAEAMMDNAKREADAIVEKAEADSKAMVARRKQMAEDKIAAAERDALEDVRIAAANAAAAASKHHFADQLAVRHCFKALAPLGQGQCAVDCGGDFSCLCEVADRFIDGLTSLGEAPRIFARAQAHDGKAFDQRNVGRDICYPSTGEAHHLQLSAKGDAARAFVKDITADRIEHDIAQSAAGDFGHLFAEAPFSDNAMIRLSHCCNPRAFVLYAGRGDHSRAQGFGQISRRQSYASRCAMHTDPLARM